MSRLETISTAFREELVVQNDYKENTPYNISHADALSTGDEQGKGPVGGNIGGKTDITMRGCSLARNPYTSNRQYDASTA